VVPLVADDVPIHHRPLAAGVRGRHRIVGVIQVGRADGEQNAKNNSDKDTHDETPRSRSQTQLTEMRFQRSQGGLEDNCDSKSVDFGSFSVNHKKALVVL
jgi:hypothetical protein